MSSLTASERLPLPPPARPRLAGRVLARAAAFAEASHLRLCTLLILLSLACFLPGFTTLQPMDRDEPRYAQATKQMLETGDFVADISRIRAELGWAPSVPLREGLQQTVDFQRRAIS